jgi:anti-sigma factor RsiW
MKIDQVYDKLAEYVDGGLTVAERRELEAFAAEDCDFAEAIILCRTVNRALETQAELTPRVDFTLRVLKRCGIVEEQVETPRRRMLNLLETWAPGLALAAALAVGAHPLWETVISLCTTLGEVITGLTGLTVFSTHPVFVLGLAAPVLAVVLVATMFADRWRYSR